MTPFTFQWSKGNDKLAKLRTLGFGIPAFQSADGFRTCPRAGVCATVCYARQGRYTLPVQAQALERNLSAVRLILKHGYIPLASQHHEPTSSRVGSALLADAILADLTRIRPSTSNIVRVHHAGDFFSQAYLNAWFEVAREQPDRTFYAYTKALDLDLWTAKPANFQIVQSAGGQLDARIDFLKPHAVIFPTHEDMRRSGYTDGTDTDGPAIRGALRIGLVYHGSRNLTERQGEALLRSASALRSLPMAGG